MVPIIELSKNPMWINHYNLYHDRSTPNTPAIISLKEAQIAAILTKPSKSEKEVVKGRKTFLPNLNKIEIDITYDCNLKCVNCNRSSTQAPVQKGMRLEEIKAVVRDSIVLGKKWELINLLGGEPTLHPQFQEIVHEILFEYVIPFSPQTRIQITSNGFGAKVQNQLDLLPKHPQLIVDDNSFKEDRIVAYFTPFNDAPIDNPEFANKEFHKGCWVTAYCGIGLNQGGYYPCGVAGGIDRVFGLNKGIKKLKDVDTSIAGLLDTFCRYCGNFSESDVNQGNYIPRHEKAALTKSVISKSWKTQYKKYNGK